MKSRGGRKRKRETLCAITRNMAQVDERARGRGEEGEAAIPLSINEDENASWQTQSNLAVSLPSSFGGGASFHPRSLRLSPASNYYYCCHRGSYCGVAAIVVVAAACSSYKEGCHLARRPTATAHTSLSLSPALPTMHCSAFEFDGGGERAASGRRREGTSCLRSR